MNTATHAPLRRPFARGFARVPLASAIVVVALAAGCGGGGTSTVVGGDDDIKEVVPGFSGDLAFYDPSINNEGIGGGADGDGGIGVGGSLGQFRGAEVVVRLPDGTELGRAIVDDVTGLVTVRPGRSYNGPLLIEVLGRDGATYYDEGRRARLPFPAGRSLRARVPVVRGNIGVTPLTEAAAAYQDANPGAGTAAEQIARALDVVRSEIAQVAPSGYDIDDPTRLPVLISESTPAGSVPNTDTGRYALLLAGLADLAATYNPSLPRPADALAQQLAADLTDGRINGVQASGAPLAPEAEIAYSQPRLADQLVTSIASTQQVFADPDDVPSVPSVVKHGRFSVTGVAGGVTAYRAVLLSDGRVQAQAELGGGALGSPLQVATGVRALFSGIDNFANTLALIMRRGDGTLIGVGNNASPAFQFGQLTPASTGPAAPIELNALGDLKSIGFGSAHQVGLRQDGTVVAWGDESAGQIDGQPGFSGGSPSPRVVALPGSARAVAGTADVSIAVLNDGTVMTWGSDPLGGLGQGVLDDSFAAPGHVVTADGSLLGAVIAVQTCFRTTVAVRSDGSVWAWGDDELGLLGNGGASNLQRAFAAPVPGLPAVRKVVMGLDGAYALTTDGQVFYWGLTANGGRAPVARVAGVDGTRDVITLGSGNVAAQDNAGTERVMRFGALI